MLREFGSSTKEMDLIDKRQLSTEQMLNVVSMTLMDGNKNTLPHPEVSWSSFRTTVLKSTAPDVFDPRVKIFCKNINLQTLQNIYGPKNNSSGSCNIS